ncbi:MAG: thioredoxin family protein [Melioribacteraceae bacterium]|nr:thioredoxin family protein [Melioribacteraceae bacterium]
MQLTLFVTDDCSACVRAVTKIKEVINGLDGVELNVKNIKETKPQNVFIVPALFIDDQLYLYGEVDSQKLVEKINSKFAG